MRKLITAIMNWIMENFLNRVLGLKSLEKEVSMMIYQDALLDGEVMKVKTTENNRLDDLEEALADLSMELKILEVKVQRLCELRDTLGHVPLYEKGGKQ